LDICPDLIRLRKSRPEKEEEEAAAAVVVVVNSQDLGHGNVR